MSYVHKSGEKATKKGQTSLDLVGFFTEPTDSSTLVNQEQETVQTVQNPPVNSSTIVEKSITYYSLAIDFVYIIIILLYRIISVVATNNSMIFAFNVLITLYLNLKTSFCYTYI